MSDPTAPPPASVQYFADTRVVEWSSRLFRAASQAPYLFDPIVFDHVSEILAERLPHDRLSVVVWTHRTPHIRLAALAHRAPPPVGYTVHAVGQHWTPPDVKVWELATDHILRRSDDGRTGFSPLLRDVGVRSYVIVPVATTMPDTNLAFAFGWYGLEQGAGLTDVALESAARMLQPFTTWALHFERVGRLSTMLDRLPHGVLGMDAGGTIVESNAVARQLFTPARESITGLSLTDLLTPATRTVFTAALAHEHEVGPLLLEVDRSDGSKPIDVVLSARHPSGPVEREVFVQDAADRVHHRAELGRRTEALAFLTELAETVAGELNADVALDRAIGVALDRRPVTGVAIARVVTPDERLRLVAARGVDEDLLRALVARSPASIPSVSRYVPPSDVSLDLAARLPAGHCGLLVPLHHAEQLVGVGLFVAPEELPDASIELLLAGARAMAVSLHASLEYDTAVRLAAERRQLLDSIPSIVFRCDPETGTTLYANAAVQRVLGTRVELALGLPGLEGLLADDAEREQMAATRLAVGQGAVSQWVDRRFLNADGRTLVLRTRMYPVEDPRLAGGVVVEGIAQDVTDETEARKQLVQADRLASLGMLAAGVAHEINNPTAFISLGVQQLGRMVTQLPEDHEGVASLRKRMNEVLGELSDGVQRIVQIVGELKLFARIPESAFSTPVDVNRLITSAVTLVRSELRRRARIEVDLGELPPLPGDHARLGQVFVNLLINAAQAIPPGNEQVNVVRVTTRAFDGYVAIEVADTGVGIPAENLSRIFDPFFTTKPPGEGTGLGLAISFDLVRRAGGQIDVLSTVGKGTTFVVKLPVREFVPQRGSKPQITAPVSGRRVLVVEDEHHLGVAIARALASTYLVELAPDAETALERIDRGGGIEYDAVLCDLRMPRMDGRAFYDAVRARWPAQAERFVFLTGAGFGGEFEAFVHNTDRPVLEKPFEMSELEEVVAQVVNPGGRSGSY